MCGAIMAFLSAASEPKGRLASKSHRRRETANHLPKTVFSFQKYFHHTLIVTGADGIPLATTTRALKPRSIVSGGSNNVDTCTPPVATPMELWLCVKA